eukprot:8785921-Heterocapsa_arctica.AAC.1
MISLLSPPAPQKMKTDFQIPKFVVHVVSVKPLVAGQGPGQGHGSLLASWCSRYHTLGCGSLLYSVIRGCGSDRGWCRDNGWSAGGR